MHAVLFDIDGTLIRGEGMGRLALQRAFADTFDVEAVGREELVGIPFNGRSDPAIVADMASALGIAPESFAGMEPRFRESYIGHLRITVDESRTKRTLPGVVGLVEELHAADHVALGLLTGNIEAGARIKLQPFALNEFFSFGGFGDDGPERSNIAARAGERARDHAGREIPPEKVLVIGDTIHDVAAGRTHRFRTVAVTTGGVSEDELASAGPDRVFDDLSEAGGFPAWLRESFLGGTGN